MHRKVTFGDDGSPGATTAWEWITAHPWPEWVLDVITVEPADKKTDASPLGYDALHEWEPSEPRIIPTTCGFAEVHELTAHHDPRVILGTCPDSTLLVVGPRGKGLLKALHIGSTTEWLMQCPNTPLLIARQGEPTRSILVCIDGSRHADAAVDLLVTLPWVASTHITVLAVVEADNQIREHARSAADRLAATGADVEIQIVLPDSLALTTNARVTIFEVVSERQPDLIALGTKGLTGLPRLQMGSVASSIARHAGTSVLLVRDRSEDDGPS